ncbi:hypothetical protein ACLOJK_006929, partial [Asimina triloba]
THSVLLHQEETGLPFTPPQRPPEETTDVVPIVSLTEPVGMIALDAERSHRAPESPSATAHALMATTTRLVDALRHTPIGTFGHPDAVAPCETSSGRKCTSAVRGLPSDLGGTAYIHVGEGNAMMPNPTSDVVALGCLPASCRAPNRS